MGMLILFVVVVLVGAILWGWAQMYNQVNPLWHRINETAANIEVVLNKRLQLINSLTEIASRYVGHEQLVHLQVSADRAQVGQAASASGSPAQTINFFSSLAAGFPVLKADQTYLRLMDELTRLETEVQNKYEFYNQNAREYNVRRASFPTLLFADIFGFHTASYLDPSHPALQLSSKNTTASPTGTVMPLAILAIGTVAVFALLIGGLLYYQNGQREAERVNVGSMTGAWVKDASLPPAACKDASAFQTHECLLNPKWSEPMKFGDGPTDNGMQLCFTRGAEFEKHDSNGTTYWRFKAPEGFVMRYRIFPPNVACPAL